MGIVKPVKLSGGKLGEIVPGDTIGPITVATGTLTRAAGAGNGTQSVTLGFSPSYVKFSAVSTADTQVLSDGWDTGSVATSTWSFDLTLLATIISTNARDASNSIHIQNLLGAGFSALITSKSSTGFTLTWTQIGGGLAMSVQYLAVL